MKQLFVDKERYQFTTTSTTARSTNSRSSNIGGGGGSGDNDMNMDRNMNMNIPGIMRAGRASSSSSSSSLFSLPKSDQAEATTHQTIHHEEQQQQQISKTTTTTSSSSNTYELKSKSSKSNSLLDLSLIRNVLLRETPWAESHGANHLSYLGAGMLYYFMAYSFRSQTIVVLGSGGGYVPRLLKQAQRDLLSAGIRPDTNSGSDKNQKGGPYELYLVDAHLGSAGWGSTFYAQNDNTTMKNEYSDINYIF